MSSLAARLVSLASGEFGNPFTEQVDYFRQKVSLPTKTYADVAGRGHDRAFVVAGVEREDILTDLRQAVDAGIAKGETLDQFQKRFDKIVEQKGWIGGAGGDSAASRAWRARVIYETNIRTSYMAGRLKQLRDPEVLKAYPYWEYRHADLRIPAVPRWEHQGWDGLILAADSPFWKTHFPPNGWFCTCGIRPVSRAELKRRRGKEEPDSTPPIIMDKHRDPKTGEWIDVPRGIDPGWDHMPGDSWERGLVPPELQTPLPASATLAPGARSGSPKPDLPPLSDISKPIAAEDLPGGKQAEFYVDAVLGLFGASRGENGAAVFRDAAGNGVVVSESLFQNAFGQWKVFKRERADQIVKAAEALRDPDEIWVDWERNVKTGAVTLRRRYIRNDGTNASVAVFEWGRGGWRATTLFASDETRQTQRDAYIENQRHGALLYRRAKEKRDP